MNMTSIAPHTRSKATPENTKRPQLVPAQTDPGADLRAPDEFAFNFTAYAECGLVLWDGPKAYTDDENLGVSFAWTPEKGLYAAVDALDTDYTVEQIRQLHARLGACLEALDNE